MTDRRLVIVLLLLAQAGTAPAQTTREEQAVGQSINYVFATDLGSGVYELDGRTLQIYRATYRRELPGQSATGPHWRFVLPVTFGFFDFSPVDVVSKGIPERVDSFSLVPGFELESALADGWRLIPYARAGFSIASSSVDGVLYGAGLRLQRDAPLHGWDAHLRSELAFAGVDHRDALLPQDRFLRARQAIDLTRALNYSVRGRAWEVGLYGIVDLVFDPPAAPLAQAEEVPLQAELGITLATRPRVPVWRWHAPRVGFGYRFADELSAWRIVVGAPF